MRLFLYKTRSLLLTALLFVALLACKDEQNPVTTSDINLETTSLGKALTGDGSHVLYVFAGDANGNANCTGNCLSNWPLLYKERPTIGNGLTAATSQPLPG